MINGDELTAGPAMADYVRSVFLEEVPGDQEIKLPPADSDGDGIEDSIDQCPDTPRGIVVNKKGCWTGEVMANVLFDFDRHTIKPEGEIILNNVFRLLMSPPIKNEPTHHRKTDPPHR